MTSPADDEVERRLSSLERRFVELTGMLANRGMPGAEGSPMLGAREAPVRGEDPLWALHELERQLADYRSSLAEGDAGGEGRPLGAVMLVGSVEPPIGPIGWQLAQTADALLEWSWEELAPALAALGHPVRLGLLHRILTGTTQTAELADASELGTTGQLHHHLRILVGAGWLRSPRRGHYEIPSGRVIPLLVILLASGDG